MSDLEQRVFILEKMTERLLDEVAALRARFGVSERGRCPKCKAPIHRAAKACKFCGASWGEPPEGSGLPIP